MTNPSTPKKNPWKKSMQDNLTEEDYVLYNTPQDEQEVYQELTLGSAYRIRVNTEDNFDGFKY